MKSTSATQSDADGRPFLSRPCLRAAVLLTCLTSVLTAQTPDPAPSVLRSGYSAFLSFGSVTLSGGLKTSTTWGATAAGVTLEQPLGDQSSWRVELLALGGRADLGEMGSFAEQTKVTAGLLAIGGSVRRYNRSGVFVGVGTWLGTPMSCDVDFTGGPGFFGGSTEACVKNELGLRKASAVLGGTLTAGVQSGRWEIDARFDRGFQPTLDSPDGGMTMQSLSAGLHYRFGRQQ